MRSLCVASAFILGSLSAWGAVRVSPNVADLKIAQAEIYHMYGKPLGILIPYAFKVGRASGSVKKTNRGPFEYDGWAYTAKLAGHLGPGGLKIAKLLDVRTTRCEIGPAPEMGVERVIVAVQLTLEFPSGQTYEGRAVLGSSPYHALKHWKLANNPEAISAADVVYWKVLMMALIDVEMQRSGQGRLQNLARPFFRKRGDSERQVR